MKVWMITGSSRGLGRAIAEAVLAKGDRLFATARQTQALKDLVDRFGDRIETFPLDVTDAVAAAKAVNMAVSTFGRLDVLVNNAGYGTVSPIEDTSIEEFRAQIETNLFGAIFTTRAAIPIMRAQGAGHIIQFSSVGGRTGAMGRAAYSAAKWGVEGFSEVLAKEVTPLGIKVTIMEPGGFRTGFAAPSTIQTQIRPEYDSTVGAAARFQTEYNGKQPGDPKKGAEVVLKVADMDDPPLRLLLGSDAVKIVEQADLARMEADRRWRELSSKSDF
ncbi:MAG TPA: SDR family NAD(P)-dependent oxidoreductase [Bryobacteraceae bacterium]|nr:SDR family NAD(P)-dependent oxidoreductase [Bryobacteraceae bacterium]